MTGRRFGLSRRKQGEPGLDLTVKLVKTIELANASDNSTVISDADGYVANVTLTGRTLYKDGEWNTLCLPFDVTLSGSALDGAVPRPLSSAGIDGTTLSLQYLNCRVGKK